VLVVLVGVEVAVPEQLVMTVGQRVHALVGFAVFTVAHGVVGPGAHNDTLVPG
jgi:hypothetical protein